MVGWPSVITAVGTGSLAAVGVFVWRQNGKLVQAAIHGASASNLLVAEEMRGRELQWEPWPSVRWVNSVVGSGGKDMEIELTNSGGGPAISCRLVVKQCGNDGWITPALDVPSGATVSFCASQVLDTSSSVPLCTWVGEDEFNHNAESVAAIFTKDVLGARYRFLVVRDGSSQVIIERRERWRVGEVPVPTWAFQKVIWPDYGV